MLTVPLPRYVLVACCDETSHVSNRQDLDFFREISGSEKSLTDAAAAGERTSEARILNILEFFRPLESPLQELTTADGTSIWAGDGVHLTSNATRVAAIKLMVHIGGGETAEPANKRARLESVIPVKTAPLPSVKAAQPVPPLPPRLVPPPLWLSGQLPANQRGNHHLRGQQRGSRGGQSARGVQPGFVRVAPPPPGVGTRAGPGRPPSPMVKVYQESVTLMQNLKKAESLKKETNESETA